MKETHYKLKHRVTALFAAAVMLCSMLPGAAFAEEPTPQPTEETMQMEQQTEPSETDNGQTDESSPDPGEDVTEATPETAEEQPAEEEISAAVVGAELYTDLPDAPIGSYIGSEGLPVATGETKIGICEWPESQLEETSDSYLTAAALDNDGLTMAAPLLDGADYAIVPIMAQVEYPADGSTLDLVLPDGVTLLDYYGTPVEDAESLLHNEYSETSAAVLGVYVQADADFTAQLVYTAPDGSTLTKTLQVTIDRNVTAEYPFPDSEIAAFAERPTPAVTSGKITKVAKVNGTWLIWFNGEPAYCCTHGANGQPAGCPTYTYVNTSTVGADQCIPGDHYGNQIRIWGGLNQLALSDAEDLPAVFSADEGEETSLLDFCASIYDDVQMYIIENFPESTAAEIYLASADELLNGVETYASARGYYTYIYNPGRAGWQTVALIGPEIGEEEPEPEPVVQEYYASWEAPAQTASGSFDFSYGIRTDKIQLKTQEKVDGATIEIEPITKSGSIEGGSWSISPAGKQTVTTSGHTADDNYQKNGGDAGASWSLHYAVTKTSGTRNGQVGPFTTQEAADAAASSARDAAIAELQVEAQNAVNNAIAAAKAQLGSIQFRYEEITVPYGFGKYWGKNGSSQTISVPANTNNDYVMKNDEWSLQVNLKKTDSETGSQIAADAQYEIYQWDVVTGKYQPTSGYNTYSVQRQGDGSYAVINSAAYAVNDAMRHTLYYTQRNQGKFILVETKAPDGYFGDWTDIDHPGTAGTPLGKRAYYVEINKDTNNTVLWLDNADYNADILTVDKGGTKLVTSGGVETTVSIYNTAKDSTRTYNTDNSGKAANEDSYTTTATDGVMKNDRTLGEISISKVDLDAVKYTNHGNATLDGAVYDLYAAEDITHPDGVTGVVDYSKIVDANGNPIWHTTIRDNSGQWVNDYLPILKKDHLVASAKIEDGWLTFANLYLGKYYVVERSTGTVIPLREGALAVSGTYPTVDSRTKAATEQVAALASSNGQYTDWVYKNQFSTITKGKALDGTVTYDAYSLSFANGYLCDEHNYYIAPAYSDEGWYVEKTTFADDNAVYKANYHIHRDNAQTESQDQIAKGNVEISKIISSSGESNGQELEDAGFTFYLVSDLSKAAQFTQSQTGAYSLQSILDCYLDRNYNNDHPKWDFSGEGQAVARTYEVNAAEIAAYNKTLTAAGDNKNGKGDGWQPTGTANEYRLAEIFSNDTGNIRVQGLPYGTYLVVETTVPKDLYQAEPYLVVIDRNSPMSAMTTPKGSQIVGSDSYQKFTVLDEQIEVYLRITKLDEETVKPVLLPGTAFQIYYLDDDGNYRMENGAPKLVRMTDTVNGHLTKNVTTFYTNAEGILTLPEKLPLGKYRIVETNAPNGYYNAWAADASHYVDFTITTDRIYQATGDKNENGMDTLVIGETYSNHETLGKLTIRKTGEVLTGWQSELGSIDPWMTGEAESGNFTYETRPLAGAEYTITAAEDIYTQDRQLDNYGNRTLWYAKGDVVAVVTTGDGTADTAVFAPARTAATYDFLSVIHDGTIGEVSVTLPLGSYHIAETKPPYGYVGTDASFDVTLAWDNQTQEIVAADAVEFHNESEKAKVGMSMELTKRLWEQPTDKGVLAYHIIQSFSPGEATPDQVHKIGCEFARRFLADRFECTVSTHLDKGHLHNHIVVNSVSYADGKMFRNNFDTYYHGIRQVSDELCRENRLSVIETDGKGKSYDEWLSGRTGKPTIRGMVRKDMEQAIAAADSFDGFILELQNMGYTVKYGPRVEHMAVRHKDAQRNIRIDRLDPRFSETALREYYRQLHRMPTEMQQEYRQENAPAKPKWQPTELQPTVRRARYLGKLPRRYPKVSGFMACYYHYCALLRKAYHGKSTKRCYFLLREDFLLFSRYQQQTKFLWENHIETMDELLAYKENAEVQIQQLARQRKVLYRQKREPERAAREEKIKSLTQQMKALRHEVYICSDIETDAAEVQEKLWQAELAAQEERNEVKQDEQRRRSSRSDGAGSLTGYRSSH